MKYQNRLFLLLIKVNIRFFHTQFHLINITVASINQKSNVLVNCLSGSVTMNLFSAYHSLVCSGDGDGDAGVLLKMLSSQDQILYLMKLRTQ